MKYMDQFVNQNINLVLHAKHSHQLQSSLTGFGQRAPSSVVNSTLSLPDHRAVVHSQGKN